MTELQEAKAKIRQVVKSITGPPPRVDQSDPYRLLRAMDLIDSAERKLKALHDGLAELLASVPED